MTQLKRYGILNDVHFPFEDRARYELALHIFEAVGIDGLYLNGDIGEFLGCSAHPKHPGETFATIQEITYINKRFDELQERFPGVPVKYICGNHEYRFFRYIRDLAPQMWGLIDCPSLFKFEERPHWKFVDYGPTQLVRCGESNLYLRHEPLGGGKGHARLTAENANVDLAYGHTHQYQVGEHKKFGVNPQTVRAYSLGWLGDPKWHVFDYRGAKESWTRGFSIVTCNPETGDYTLDFINLEKLPAFYNGRMYGAP